MRKISHCALQCRNDVILCQRETQSKQLSEYTPRALQRYQGRAPARPARRILHLEIASRHSNWDPTAVGSQYSATPGTRTQSFETRVLARCAVRSFWRIKTLVVLGPGSANFGFKSQKICGPGIVAKSHKNLIASRSQLAWPPRSRRLLGGRPRSLITHGKLLVMHALRRILRGI